MRGVIQLQIGKSPSNPTCELHAKYSERDTAHVVTSS